MSEKASRNEGADEERTLPGDVPGIPPGEELALGPVEGEEIDPLPKWWDEPLLSETSRPGNRRLEDGIEFESPRRRKTLPPIDEEALALPILEEEKREASTELSVGDPGKQSGGKISRSLADLDEPAVETPLTPSVAPAAGEPTAESSETSEVTKAPKGDLADLLGSDAGTAEPEETASLSPTPNTGAAGDKTVVPEKRKLPSLDLIDGEVAESSPIASPKSPPPLPAAAGVVAEAPALDEPIEVAVSADEEKPEEEARKAEGVKPVLLSVPERPGNVDGDDPADAATSPSEETDPVAGEEAKDSPEADSVASVAGEATKEELDAVHVTKETVGEEAPTTAASPEIAPAAVAPDPSSPATKRKAGCWTVFATGFFMVAMLFVALVAGSGFYAWSKMGEFEQEVTSLARTKLAGQGIHFESGSWSYVFPRGLVFDEVTFFDDETLARPVLKAASLGVDVDLAGLITNPGELGSVELSLEDSKVTLYQKGEQFAEIGGVDAELLADSSKLTVERFSAPIGGLLVDLAGEVIFPGREEGANVGGGEAEEAGPGAATLSELDFSAFLALQPWLAFETRETGMPELSLRFSMDSTQPDLARIEGRLEGEGVTWKGVEFASVFASFQIDPGSGELRFPRVQVGYGDGLVSAVLAVDTGAGKLRIEKLLSTADVSSLLPALDPSWAETFRLVRFADAPTLQIVGEIPIAEPGNADLKIRYEHRQGLVHVDGERELPISDIRGLFTYDSGALETNDTAARLFGGQVYVNGAMNFLREKRPFTGLVEITGLSLEEAAKWFGQEGSGLGGRLSLTFRGTGNEEISSISGGGNLRIEEASLPEFPAIGRVQAMLGGVLPLFTAKSGTALSGAYIVESGVLVTSDLTVRSAGARLVTNGSVNLAEDTAKFVATADLEPALAAATGLKDQAIQIEGDGPLKDPVLKLRQFPLGFAANALSTVTGSSPESLAGLKALVGPEDAGVISATLEGVEGLAGIGLDPGLAEWVKGLLEGAAAGTPAPETPATPTLRAIPEN